jgi:hypothetical protein
MGASGWSYHTPYDADADKALQALRDKVFASGDYYKFWQEYGDSDEEPQSIDDALELADTEGTHSILDITHVGPGFGGARVVSDDELLEALGTATPSKDQAQTMVATSMERLDRWQAVIIPTYDGGKPTGLWFVGVSGD